MISSNYYNYGRYYTYYDKELRSYWLKDDDVTTTPTQPTTMNYTCSSCNKVGKILVCSNVACPNRISITC